MASSYRVAAVSDSDPARSREAIQTLGCRAYPDLPALLGDPEIDLVVIATPSHLHAPQAIAALHRGKHVVCEKPMALSTADADRMIDAAAGADRLLTVFHNMRYWPDFLKLREVIASGRLGQIVQVRITMHRFTRRWDWQTLREFGGGALFNGGAHLVDLALQLFGQPEPMVTADLRRTLSSGDAEDHVKIQLRAPAGGAGARDGDARPPTIDVEVTNACAYPQDMWHLMGTAGGLHGSSEELHWRWVDVSALPPRPADRTPAAADRRFNREDLPWQEDSWTAGGAQSPDYARFYTDLHHALRTGSAPAITGASVRRTIATLERCRGTVAAG